jgi:hypothetical protein
MDDSAPIREGRSIADLIGQLTADLAALVRKESELIRTELSEKAGRAAKGVEGIAAGGLLLLAALLVLLQALVLALAKYMDATLAALIVGVGVAAVGFVLLRGGMKAVSPDGLRPDRSARQLKKDAELVKGKVQ